MNYQAMTVKELQALAKDVGTTYSGKSKQNLITDIQKVKRFNTQLNKYNRVFKNLDTHLGNDSPKIELRRFREFNQKLLRLQRLYKSILNRNNKQKLGKLMQKNTLRIDWVKESIRLNPEMY